MITGILSYSLIHLKPIKKLILSSVALAAMLFLFISCVKETKIKLTDEQRTTIEQEVKDQWVKLQSTIGQLDFDKWSEFFSNDEFIAAFGSTGFMPSYTAWVDTVRNSFSRRERHQAELLDLKITALTPDFALGTQVAIGDNWWKNGDYRKVKGATTNLWKKGPDGWKIIYIHESRLELLEEKLANSPQ